MSFPILTVPAHTPLLATALADPVDIGASPYTFASQPLGSGDRKIVAVLCYHGATAFVASVSIAGNAATAGLQYRNGSGLEYVEIWYLDATGAVGSTGSVVVTQGGATMANCGLGLYAISGVAGGGPDATATANGASPSTSITGAGVIIGGVSHRHNGTPTHTWTNLAEAYDEVVEGGLNYHHGGYVNDVVGSITITSTPSGAGVRNPVMGLATWGAP